ncbi:MAG: DUF2288 domain-containing protein [Gammaproteobacteria bacterium]|nr:DUF2288 domain-containing protein [Gammaproteobacteria bacterium]
MNEDLTDDELRQQLNKETGKLEWRELAPHFARGAVILVDAHLDLIEVAAIMVRDDKSKVEAWIEERKVRRADDEDARRWSTSHHLFWAVVAAPWVVVQEVVEN